jgi:TonB family protein
MKTARYAFAGLALMSSLALQAVTTQVRLKEGGTPAYPEELKASGVEGMAKVKVVIDQNGIVVEAELVEATHEAFGVAALETVKTWTFFPGTEDGNILSAKPLTFP